VRRRDLVWPSECAGPRPPEEGHRRAIRRLDGSRGPHIQQELQPAMGGFSGAAPHRRFWIWGAPLSRGAEPFGPHPHPSGPDCAPGCPATADVVEISVMHFRDPLTARASGPQAAGHGRCRRAPDPGTFSSFLADRLNRWRRAAGAPGSAGFLKGRRVARTSWRSGCRACTAIGSGLPCNRDLLPCFSVSGSRAVLISKPKASPTLNSRRSNSWLSFSLQGARSPHYTGRARILATTLKGGKVRQVAEAVAIRRRRRRRLLNENSRGESVLHHRAMDGAGEFRKLEPPRSTPFGRLTRTWGGHPPPPGAKPSPRFRQVRMRIGSGRSAMPSRATSRFDGRRPRCGGRGVLVELDVCRRAYAPRHDPHPGRMPSATMPLIKLGVRCPFLPRTTGAAGW